MATLTRHPGGHGIQYIYVGLCVCTVCSLERAKELSWQHTLEKAKGAKELSWQHTLEEAKGARELSWQHTLEKDKGAKELS